MTPFCVSAQNRRAGKEEIVLVAPGRFSLAPGDECLDPSTHLTSGGM